MGVQLFFVISAFTLASSFYARKRQESHPTADFFVRRLCRIAPMFWAALLVYTNLDQVRYFNQRAFAPEGIHWWHIALTALFLHGWYPTAFNSVVPGGWSVGVEMSFYVLVPLLLKLITSYDRALWYTFGALILSVAVNALMMRLVAPSWTNDFQHPFEVLTTYWLPAQLPVFMLGFVLFFLFKREEEHTFQINRKPASLFLLATSLYLMVFATSMQPNVFLPSYFVFGIAFALLTWSLHLFPWRVFVNKASVYIGKISYSCYLTHFFVVYVLAFRLVQRVPLFLSVKESLALPAFFLLSLAVTLILSTLTFHFIETPGINLGKRLIAHIEKAK